MKRVLFLTVLLWAPAQAKQMCVDAPSIDIQAVENDVPDAEQWLREAWSGKVNKSSERIIQLELQKSDQEGSDIPATKRMTIEKYLNRPDHKNRKARDLENAKNREK